MLLPGRFGPDIEGSISANVHSLLLTPKLEIGFQLLCANPLGAHFRSGWRLVTIPVNN